MVLFLTEENNCNCIFLETSQTGHHLFILKGRGGKLWGQVITQPFYWSHWAVCGKMNLCPTLGGTTELGAARIASSE